MNKKHTSPFFIIEDDTTYDDYLDAMRSYRRELVNKWAWLLEGTRKQKLEPIPESLYEPMAMLFENQLAVSRGIILGSTRTSNIALPEKYTLPIVRKVFPKLIVNKIASLQPMPLSSGGTAKIFYQDFYRQDVSPETSLTESDYDYALGSEGSVPKRIRMTITSETITAVKDILGAVWSTEVEEDARGALGIDVPRELLNQAAAEILREIEQRVLTDLLNQASAGNVNWSPTVGAGYTAKEWYETLMHAFISAESLIEAKRYRTADWIIAGRNVVQYFRKMQTFNAIPRNRNVGEAFMRVGVELVGEITGFWDVYSTPYMPANKAIMGIYPSSQTDTGYVYAPYIPIDFMPRIYASYDGPSDSSPGAYRNTDESSQNIRTRYGKKTVVGDMFATVTITS